MIGRIIRFITPILVLGMAAGVVFLLFKTKPAQVKNTAFSIAPSVRVITVKEETIPFTLAAKGVVIAEKEVQISTQVSGRIMAMHEDLEPGGYLSEGDTIVEIERRDYELRVQQEEAQVAKARLALELERGKKRVAEREWQLLGEQLETSPEGRELALRKPQIKSAKAELKGAISALKMAKLNLERTQVLVPFNALVLNRAIQVGEQITPQMGVATLVGADQFWVQASLSVVNLKKMFDLAGDKTIVASISMTGEKEDALPRKGKVIRTLPNVDPNGRMARILVEVEDPIGLLDPTNKKSPLLLGSYVSLSLEAGSFNNAFQIPRIALTDKNTVWTVTADNTLQEKSLTLLSQTKTTVIVKGDMQTGEKIVISPLASPLPGLKVRISDSGEENTAAKSASASAPEVTQ